MSLNPALSLARAANLRVSGSLSGTVSFSAGGRPNSKAYPTYQSNGYIMNTNGYLANPTRAAQVAANNAGALTRSEANRMGLTLHR
jgi:hypothetical protein